MGSFIQGTSQFVFQQYDGTSNLYFFDTATGTRTPAPSKVNGLGWVYWPVGSTDYLLYMRATHRFHTRSLVLYDRAAKTNRVLIPDIGGKGVLPGFVGSQYAAWLTCGSQACNDYVYDIGTKELWKVPAPDGRSTFSPTIDEATDQLYFVRSSSDRCGVAVTIRVATIGSDDSTVLASLPRGVDTGSMMSLTANPGSGFQDLYFMRWDCRDQRGDVFAIRSIDDVVMRGGRTLGPVPSGRYRPVPRSIPVAGSVPG